MGSGTEAVSTRSGNVGAPAGTDAPLSLAVANKGIGTSGQFASFMAALMCDIIAGRVTPSVGNAACNAGGKLLKVAELQQKYGIAGKDQQKVLILASPPEGVSDAP